jgi:hypothetical protein
MLVTNIGRSEKAEQVQLSASIKDFPGTSQETKLWYRYPHELAENLSTRAEPFLAALLPAAMADGKPLLIDGDISERMLAGCGQIMKILNNWYPRLRIVPIKPRKVLQDRFRATGVGCFFTGGVDSFYTLLKNLDMEQGDGRITHLIYVRDFDIPLEKKDLHEEVSFHLKEVARETGLTFVPVETNLRRMTYRTMDWFLQDGAGYAGVGLCMSPLFKRVYIASTATYSTLPRWISHPLIDPLWTTESTEFRHDGCEASRLQKVLWYVGTSDMALKHLRFCNRNYNNLYNCGICEKCQYTMVNLHIAGALDRCKSVEGSFDLNRIRKIRVKHRETRDKFLDNLEALEREGRDPELQMAIKEALKGLPAWKMNLRLFAREFDDRLLGSLIRRSHRSPKRII